VKIIKIKYGKIEKILVTIMEPKEIPMVSLTTQSATINVSSLYLSTNLKLSLSIKKIKGRANS
jgi:hypothetical protein